MSGETTLARITREFRESDEREARCAEKKRAADCEAACEGFTDPMELRRQRDEAVGILKSLLEDDVHEPTCSVPASSVLVATSLIARIDQGETP